MITKIDEMINQNFGELLVIKRIIDKKCRKTKYLCKCSCGKTRIVDKYVLKHGMATKCRYCGPQQGILQDLTGKKFDKLTVIKRTDDKIYNKKSKSVRWECKCDCGNIVIRERMSLIRNKSACDQCLKDRFKRLYSTGYESISGYYWSRVYNLAKKRNLEFTITKEYVWKLFCNQNAKCALSGINITFANSAHELSHGQATASLDRIDSKKGYIIGNVQWVHKDINKIKTNFEQEKFINYCIQIANYNQPKNQIINIIQQTQPVICKIDFIY